MPRCVRSQASSRWPLPCSAFSVFIGMVTITPAVYPALMTSVTVAFVIFTILCIIGVGASYVRGTIHSDTN
ncbi:MAG: hypothetical protein MZV63_46140 [Marinilabiliales bacterium]|nr:hypothetical protein [Marinilabiliales bacterium]